jgi:Ino eighty subunit 2
MRVNEVDALKDVIGGGRIVEGARRSRNVPPPRISGRRPDKPRYAEYGESDIEDDYDEEDEDDDEQDEDDEADEDEPMPDVEADSDQDEEDEDQEMEDEPSPPKRSAPPPKAPKITLKQPAHTNGRGPSNPKLIVTPAQVGPVKSVEEQEMDEEEEDEEEDGSSELSEDDEEDDEEEDEEQEETMQLNAGADQGAGDELGDDEELDEDDEDLDSDDETPGSGTATPDITKLTKRQRGRPEDSTELMALDMAPQQRKFFTDHEKAMKKDEHARKRKELTKRKIQEEKAAALNRLVRIVHTTEWN